MKLKTKIARVSILALSFCLMFLCVVCLSTHKVKADSIPMELLQYEIVDSSSIEDLPYLNPGYPIYSSYPYKRWLFGYFYYNGGVCYFLVLTPGYSQSHSSTPCTIYMTNTDLNALNDELVDQEYYELDSEILSDSCDSILDICVDSGFLHSVFTTDYYILQNNFYGFCCTGYYHNDILQVYANNVETQPEFFRKFGPLNTAYYQEVFYSHILDHVQTLISNDGASYDVTSYQRGVQYGKQSLEETVRQKDSVIQSKNEIIADLQEQLISGDSNFADFRNLLSAIFMFPIQFFTVGLDVDLFGINIGDFLLGLFMIVILLTIFKFLLGRRF